MGWNHFQDFSLGHVSSGTSASTGTGPSQSVIGNWVTVFVWGTNLLSINSLTVTDNASTPNTYTQLKNSVSNIQNPTIWCAIYIGQIQSLPSSGNLAITASSGTAGVLDVCAAEWGGGRGSSVIDTQSSQSDLTGNPNPGPLTTNTLDGLIVAVCVSQDGSNPGTITVPTNFTSVASELNGHDYKMGNGCWRITSGIGVNSNAGWTFDSGAFANAYAALQITLALKLLPPVPVNSTNAESGVGA